MPIASSDIALLTSSVAGSAGGAVSATGVTSGVNNNIWPDITDAERLAGGERFRKVFWKNNSAVETALKPVLYVPVLPVGCTVGIGLGLNHAEDADAAQGNMSALGATTSLALVSNGADVRTATIYGLDNSGTPAPVTATIALAGASEVVTAGVWTSIYAVYLSASDAARSVVIKQGAGGATIGTIGPTKRISWRWITGPSSKAAGLRLPDLPATSLYGMWMRSAWSAGAPAVRPDTMTVMLEEDA